jgi:hypothetical protein
VNEVIGDVLLIVSAVLATGFIGVYHWSAVWWRSSDGRHVMGFMAVLAALLDLGVVRIVIGAPAWFLWLRLVVFVAVPVLLAQRLRILVRAQFRKRRA